MLRISLAISLLLLLATGPTARADAYSPAQAALQEGRADEALRLLDRLDSDRPKDPEVSNLRCRVYYSEEKWDDAVRACEEAVGLAPRTSVYHMWLGRAYGEKADHVRLVSAYNLGKRAGQEFNLAVQYDAANVQALSDLGEFDAEAPGIVGGGTDKARDVASRLKKLDLGRYHVLQARIAESKKDYAGAEQEWQAAIAAEHNSPDRWMDLASFYRRRQRIQEMLESIQKGVALDERHSSALFDAASTLRRCGRDPDLSIRLLRSYLGSSALSEDAPAFQAHWLLAELLDLRNDHAAAESEYAAARALAHDFSPAVK